MARMTIMGLGLPYLKYSTIKHAAMSIAKGIFAQISTGMHYNIESD